MLWFPKHTCPWMSLSKWWLRKQTLWIYWKNMFFCLCYSNAKLASCKSMNVTWQWSHYCIQYTKSNIFPFNQCCTLVYNFFGVYHLQSYFRGLMKISHSLSRWHRLFLEKNNHACIITFRNQMCGICLLRSHWFMNFRVTSLFLWFWRYKTIELKDRKWTYKSQVPCDQPAIWPLLSSSYLCSEYPNKLITWVVTHFYFWIFQDLIFFLTEWKFAFL